MTTASRSAPLSASEIFRVGVTIMAGSFLLCWPMLLNGFPLIFHDTNSYVRMIPEIPRSYFYKLFVFLTGFRWSIWTTAFAQSLWAGTCVFFLLNILDFKKEPHFLVAMLVLALASSLPIFASFIMPDIFTGLMILLLFIGIFLFDRLAAGWRVMLFLALLVAISAHLSHLVLALAMICLSIGWIASYKSCQFKGAVMALAACGTVAAAFIAYHGVKHHHLVLSAAGGTYFMANLIEYGPARRELQEFCPQSGYRLCAFRNELPATANQFLWNTQSPFNTQLGAFEGMRAESARLVLDTITHRPLEVLSVSIRNSLRALFAINPTIDIIRPETSVSQLRTVFRRIYDQNTVQQFDDGAQEHNRFPNELIAALFYAGFAAAVAAIAWVITVRFHAIDPRIGGFLLFSIAAYVANAVICGTLSGVFDRYQSRMSWLIPLAALLLLFDWHRQRTCANKNGL
jgi:hypothetical protein